MTDQPTLFDQPRRYPHRAGHKEGTTSRDAAERIDANGRERSLRRRCLAVFRTGWTGTADELAAKLGEPVLSVRPRVTQLFKLHQIEHTGERRFNASGATAHVWRFNRDHQEQRRAG